MDIQVRYPDDRVAYVNDSMLDRLIASNGIKEFRRSSGWVTVGVDPVRKGGEERNSSWRDRKKPGLQGS